MVDTNDLTLTVERDGETWTVEEVAKATGITETRVTHYVLDASMPRETVERLDRFFEPKPEWVDAFESVNGAAVVGWNDGGESTTYISIDTADNFSVTMLCGDYVFSDIRKTGHNAPGTHRVWLDRERSDM